jgi:hypothetical protein
MITTKLLNRIGGFGMEVAVVDHQVGERINLDVKTNAHVYTVIREVLQEHGVKGQGKCGGGFEFYPLKNGMVFAVAWNSEGLDKFYLGDLGEAF